MSEIMLFLIHIESLKSNDMAKNYSRSFILVLFFLSLCKPAAAQLSGWSYNIPIDIVNKTNTTRTNYQELLIVNTKLLIAAGKMQASGADIRIGDLCTGSPNILSHYLMADLNTDS